MTMKDVPSNDRAEAPALILVRARVYAGVNPRSFCPNSPTHAAESFKIESRTEVGSKPLQITSREWKLVPERKAYNEPPRSSQNSSPRLDTVQGGRLVHCWVLKYRYSKQRTAHPTKFRIRQVSGKRSGYRSLPTGVDHDDERTGAVSP